MDRDRKDGMHSGQLRQVDFGFGFDDEEGVGGGMAGGVAFLEGVFAGPGEYGEADAAVGAPDEIEAAFRLAELE